MRQIPAPTPRWPDLLCAYHAGDRILLTSKLFSAHVSPTAAGDSPEDPFDTSGWETYEQDWKFFFECMLAPVARQASGEETPVCGYDADYVNEYACNVTISTPRFLSIKHRAIDACSRIVLSDRPPKPLA